MNKNELYTKNGWVNAELLIDSPEPFVVAVGGRGIGKSYGILKTLHERKTPFIYMRRTQTQLDAVTIPPLNPFNQISTDEGLNITASKISKHTVGFYDADEEGKTEDKPFAIGIALSTFSSIRSLSAENFEVLFFDEIIPERHEKPIKEEGLAFANVLESLNRNRELQGRKPLKAILATNSNTINSKILDTLGCIDVLDNMARNNQFFKSVKGLIALFRFVDSPISEQKKKGVIYQTIKNEDFSGMAIDNSFAKSDYENVQVKPLQEYKPLCSYGNSTILKHKSKQEYYCIKGARQGVDHYYNMPISNKAFQKRFWFIYNAMFDNRVFYQNASVKIEIEGAFKNG